MMNRSLHTLALGAALLIGVPVIGHAQDIRCPEREERQVPAGALTEGTYNRLNRIHEAIAEQTNLDQTYRDLEALLSRVQRDPYEQAVVYQTMGHLRAMQERYTDAIRYFQRAIDLDRLPNQAQNQMYMQIFQLYILEDRFREGLRAWETWYCAVGPEVVRAEDWVYKAQAHAQLEEYRDALSAVDRAINLSDEPREQWYVFKLGMHFELNQMRPAAETLEILVQINPERRTYWIQLSQVYLQLENEAKALSVLGVAYRKGLLETQQEYLQLSSLFQSQNVPLKAAQVLQRGIEQGRVEATRRHWEMVAGAWYEARELDNALEGYERAARQATDGKLDLQRSFILVDLERWEPARQALQEALGKGGLSEGERGNAHLLLGMTEFNLGNYDQAERAFTEAANYGRLRSAANEWLSHVRQHRQS